MLDFNLCTFNSRVFPGIDPLVVRQGDRVRIRCGNLTMTNHPIHLHGHEFVVTGTDGGWTPPASRWPEVNGIRRNDIAHVPAGGHQEMTWQFARPEKFHYACLLPTTSRPA